MIALVIGARRGSLGAEIRRQFTLPHHNSPPNLVITAGVSGDEMHELNILEPDMINHVISLVNPDVIICTVGVNLSTKPIGDPGWYADVAQQTKINFLGPALLMEAVASCPRVKKLIFISSNSAHIARRNSLGYCSSKAALSMAVRCAAREWAGEPLVYAYELGLLAGTPMTQATEAVFGPAQSRMVGAENGLKVREVADAIVSDLRHSGMAYNGSTIRLDAGEQ